MSSNPSPQRPTEHVTLGRSPTELGHPRRKVKLALFAAALTLQFVALYFIVPKLLAQVSGEDLHTFMLVSMGLVFIPLIVPLLFAGLVMAGLAYLPVWSYVSWHRRKRELLQVDEEQG